MNGSVKTDMSLLMVVLFDGSYLEDIILGLTSISGGRVTMIDALSGSENLSQAIPLFAEFTGMGGRQFCKIVFTCAPERNSAERLLEILEEGGIDFTGSSLGEIYEIPLGQAVILEE